jgi:hypothetical protein
MFLYINFDVLYELTRALIKSLKPFVIIIVFKKPVPFVPPDTLHISCFMLLNGFLYITVTVQRICQCERPKSYKIIIYFLIKIQLFFQEILLKRDDNSHQFSQTN